MSNLYTLKNATDFVGSYVDTGTCDADKKRARVTEACRRLMSKADWAHTTQMVRARVSNQMFPLPRECEAIRWANIENKAANVRQQSFEFLAAGPGEIQHLCATSGYKDLIDAGWFPTMYDVPTPELFANDETVSTNRESLGAGLHLMAFTTEQEDLGRELTIYGRDRLLNDIGGSGTTFTPGETLKLNRWAKGVEGSVVGLADLIHTTKLYREVTAWVKPATKGYITLYAVDLTNKYMWLLAKAHPDDLKPVWRRYKLRGQAQSGDSANILMLCKMKALDLTRDDDILPIQNLDAIKLMVIAIREENAKNLELAMAYELNAVRLLSEQLDNVKRAVGTPQIIDTHDELAASRVNDTGIIL